MSETDRYVAVVPSPRQIILQEMGFYLFVHYGMNTFTNVEWGSGKESPSCFCPTVIDTDQWANVAAASGAGAIILTAKHHDGFCLWQTNTTEHSIKNSPYMGGKGDVVRQLADSCRRAGIKLGLYLSPWDRNCPLYGSDAYNDFYVAQLTELLTNYGEIFCLWLDGACGEGPNGKKQKYDFERFFKVALELQPNIILANMGRDVRWIGNEDGKARDGEWCVVPACVCPSHPLFGTPGAVTQMDADLGSRSVLSRYDELIWYPAEADMSIRRGWFYHPFEFPRPLSRLYSTYMQTVGANSLFLLNVPPNKKGVFARSDVRRLRTLASEIRRTFAKKLSDNSMEISPNEFCIELAGARSVRTIVLREDVTHSQRVESFSLYFYKNGELVYGHVGSTIGFSRFVSLTADIYCDKVILSIDKFRGDRIYLSTFELYG